MTWFAVRVELHKNRGEDKTPETVYDDLHADMARNRYYRYVESNDGRYGMLPPAEYFIKTDATDIPLEILEEVKEIAARTGRRATVYVTRADSWAGGNLTVISAEQAQSLRRTGKL